MGRRMRFLILSATAVLALLAAACGGTADEDADEDVAGLLADRWLRVGEDLRTSVEVYEGEVYPRLVSLLNPEMTDETPQEDLVSIPVHPEGRLLGSFHIGRPDGVDLVWLVFDVPGAEAAVSETVAGQLDETPWQVVGGQSNGSLAVVRFQSTVSGDVNGTAVIQPLPATATYALTVDRAEGEVQIDVPRHAPVPLLTAGLEPEDDGLVVRELPAGEAHAAGLREDDRITAVAGMPVKTLEDLERALRSLRSTGDPSASVVYILEIQSSRNGADSPFVLPESRPLPDGFPLEFVLGDEMVVLEVSWATQPQGTVYQTLIVSPASTSEVTDAVRQRLEDEGWEIVDDQAVGFATVLGFQDPEQRYQGQLRIDAFQRDDSFTSIELQLQTAARSGS